MEKINKETLLEEFARSKNYIVSKGSLDLIGKAYDFAENAHCNQKRRSGLDYFVHPYSVAFTLAGTSADEETVASALLHDVVEDSGVKISAIEENFGPKVANIVDALTVPKYASADGDMVEDKMAGIRKIASAEYFSREAISVKLSDILDNIQDIAHIPPESRGRFAVVSLVFLELLNHRLSPKEYSSLRCEVRERALESIISGAPNHAQEYVAMEEGPYEKERIRDNLPA